MTQASNNGITPAQVAASNGHDSAAKVLESLGADMAGICDCGLIAAAGADNVEEIPRLKNLGTNLLRAAALLLFCSVVISAMDHLEPFTVALAAMVVVWVLILFYFVKMGGITSLTVRDYFQKRAEVLQPRNLRDYFKKRRDDRARSLLAAHAKAIRWHATAIARGLEDSDDQVRRAAVEALGDLAPAALATRAEAIQILLNALGEAQPDDPDLIPIGMLEDGTAIRRRLDLGVSSLFHIVFGRQSHRFGAKCLV